MSVIEAKALFHARSQHAVTPASGSYGREVRPVQIKAFLDALPHPTALFDTDSRHFYSNQRLHTMLRHDPHPEVVLRALRCIGRDTALAKADRMHDVNSVVGSYRARATYLELQLIGQGDTVLISVEPAGEVLPSAARLRLQLALTEQEARVALLLAQRASTIEIAEQLSISKNTVRRHIERVLAKLQVHNRIQVRDRVLAAHR